MTSIAIYGFSFTKEISFDGGILIPRFNTSKQLKDVKCDGKGYVLSGFFSPYPTNYKNLNQLIFDLSAVLSFIEQKDVIICNSLEEDETPQKLKGDFPLQLNSKRKQGPGRIILEDFFAPKSRSKFISLAMNKLNENANSNQNPFRTAFYKSMVSFRENMNYVDVSYYLEFSALESLCRYIKNDLHRKAPEIITSVLKEYGFDVSKVDSDLPQRNMMHYCKLRNSLFHQGGYIAYLDNDNPESMIHLKDYSSQLGMLLSLTLMKYIEFDDGLINWDSWIDRNPFISHG
jgi:hypothetical protein